MIFSFCAFTYTTPHVCFPTPNPLTWRPHPNPLLPFVPAREDVQTHLPAFCYWHAGVPYAGVSCTIGIEITPENGIANDGLEGDATNAAGVVAVDELAPA